MSLFTKVGTQLNVSLAQQIAADFERYLDVWHSLPEVYDNDLDAQIHDWYMNVLRSKPVYPPRSIPYFSPSSANSDPRELYEKLRGAKRDGGGQPPYQGRWQRIGTAIGDVIQRDILFAERHYERVTGESPRFTFERDELGRPMFEDFAKRAVTVGNFALYGTGDGVMQYRTDDGEILRVGLEVKSKQTTYAQTSDYSTRNGPKDDHVKQTICYSLMYGSAAEPLDYYVILYVNASKKAWEMTGEEYRKSPDIKAFGIDITDDMRRDVLDRFSSIVTAASLGKAPTLDLEHWTFNNYKRACAISLSDDELAEIDRKVAAMQRSGLPDFKKRQYAEAYEMITKLRVEASSIGA